MLHIPLLRAGKPYQSLATRRLPDIRTGETVAEMSLANPGLIGRDLSNAPTWRQKLGEFSTLQLIEISKRAAKLFAEGTLPCGNQDQTPELYVRQLSATTGLPESMALANMAKSSYVLGEIETVLGGLTRGLDPSILDDGWGMQEDRVVSYRPETDLLAAVLPSNSPGVHSLWIPAFTLKTPLALKPGSKEPWTPYRIGQALQAAGGVPEALSFYPTDYSGAHELLLRSGRSLLFGDRDTVAPWRSDPRVQIHGPGWSKVILGADWAGRWEKDLDLVVSSVADNGGRSCINASGVWASKQGKLARDLAEALAQRLAEIEARPLDDPKARLAAFPSLEAAQAMSRHLDSQLAVPGAEDVTTRYRPQGRVAEAGGCAFVLPTVIYCKDRDHPLAHSEFLFPFVSVVETPQDELVRSMGETLVATALTEDSTLVRELMTATNVERFNLGSIPTSRVSWDQPHEGNLFEHLYRQRAFQGVYAPGASLPTTGPNQPRCR